MSNNVTTRSQQGHNKVTTRSRTRNLEQCRSPRAAPPREVSPAPSLPFWDVSALKIQYMDLRRYMSLDQG